MENNEELDIETVEAEDAEPRIYEMGYHIVPSVAEEGVSAEEATIKSAIETLGGTAISAESPHHMELAYTIERVTESKREKFDATYFGWVKFEMDPIKIVDLKEVFDANRQILRYMIFKTVRENTRSDVHPAAPTGRPERKAPVVKAPVEPTPPVVEEKKSISEAELDRTIEELVVE